MPMRLMLERIADVQSLYVRYLHLLLSVEESILTKQHRIADAAIDGELHDWLQEDLLSSQERGRAVQEMLKRVTSEVGSRKCRTIYALFDEAEEVVEDTAHGLVRDAGLIAAARRVKSYQIAVYEDLRQLALALGRDVEAEVLEKASHELIGRFQRLSEMTERINHHACESNMIAVTAH